jgi:hypothetical protein
MAQFGMLNHPCGIDGRLPDDVVERDAHHQELRHGRFEVQERSLMTSLRRFAFLLLPLFALTPDRPAAQAPARASFPPAAVPPRNDIRVDNRVAIPMRDGVILYRRCLSACR